MPVDILMYHSISEAGGPTSIPPAIFRAQIEAIAEAGIPVIGLDALVSGEVPERAAILTFDDGFADFADAWPVMRDHGFRPIVYLPAGCIGGVEDWRGAMTPPRRLMGWDTVERLFAEGVGFGSHTVSHPDLTALPGDQLAAELDRAREMIAARLGAPPRHVAPPYGLSNAKVRAEIAKRHATSVGTRLGPAGQGEDLHDLPRLEMVYFTDLARWRAHLAGQGAAYLTGRKLLRGVREAVSKPWARA